MSKNPNSHKQSLRTDQIIEMAARGSTDKEIAAVLGISVHTVETYWRRIRGKLGASNRAAAVIKHLQSSLEQSNQNLQEAHEKLATAFESRGATLAQLALDSERRLREYKRLHEELGLWERASHCAKTFSYEVEPSDPFRCRYISGGAEAFDIDRKAILLDEINFWDCIYSEDVASLYELTLNVPFEKNARYLHIYRLKSKEGPRWVADAHQCLYDSKDTLVAFVGQVLEIHGLVAAGIIVPKVTRLRVSSDPMKAYEPYTPSYGINNWLRVTK